MGKLIRLEASWALPQALTSGVILGKLVHLSGFIFLVGELRGLNQEACVLLLGLLSCDSEVTYSVN